MRVTNDSFVLPELAAGEASLEITNDGDGYFVIYEAGATYSRQEIESALSGFSRSAIESVIDFFHGAERK